MKPKGEPHWSNVRHGAEQRREIIQTAHNRKAGVSKGNRGRKSRTFRRGIRRWLKSLYSTGAT